MIEFERIRVTLLSSTIVLSFMLNVLVIFGLLKKQSQTTLRDLLLISLSVSGLIETCCGYAIELYGRISLRTSLYMCELAGFAVTCCALSSISHITCLAIERYLAMVCSLKAHRCFAKKSRALYFIIPAWLNGLTWALAPFYGWGGYAREPVDRFRCSVLMTDNSLISKSYNYALLLFCYAIPIIIITWCCWNVQKEFQNIHEKIRSDVNNDTCTSDVVFLSREAEQKHFNMVVMIITSFFVVWTPYALVSLWFTLVSDRIPLQLVTYSAFFAKFSVMSNPIIYIIFYKDCRKAIKKLICADATVLPVM